MATFSFEDAAGQKPRTFSFDDAQRIADPKIGQPEDLTLGEKIASVFESPLEALKSIGVSRGGAVGRLAMGAADPGVAIAQIAGNLTGNGDAVNQRIQDVEQQYQAARKAEGSTGFDPLRMAGNIAITAPAGVAAGAAKTLGAGVVRGAATGAGFGALEPVNDGGDFLGEKLKQTAIGGLGGAALAPVASALARIVSPNASTNASVKLLRDEGVTPTLGQTLGGWANALEEKGMSIPFVGDAIRSARGRAVADFDNAALNRVTEATGGPKVSGAGFDAYADTKAASKKAYDDALDTITHVNFATPSMVDRLGQLEQMAQQLPDNLATQFNKLLDQNVVKRVSPNGSMLPDFYKKLDSELGTIANRYSRSTVASEQDYGDAVKQLQQLFRDEVKQQNPQFAHALRSADEGYANLVRVRDATKAASADSEGVFTPAQLARSVRKNSQGDQYARGDALMQDLARAGSTVLSNRVPNSGTPDRIMMFAAGMHPAVSIPAAVIGATAYSKPVQNALAALVASRPANAPRAANALRRYVPRLSGAVVPMLEINDR